MVSLTGKGPLARSSRLADTWRRGGACLHGDTRRKRHRAVGHPPRLGFILGAGNSSRDIPCRAPRVRLPHRCEHREGLGAKPRRKRAGYLSAVFLATVVRLRGLRVRPAGSNRLPYRSDAVFRSRRYGSSSAGASRLCLDHGGCCFRRFSYHAALPSCKKATLNRSGKRQSKEREQENLLIGRKTNSRDCR